MTNGDYIRSMSDEQLAESAFVPCPYDDGCGECKFGWHFQNQTCEECKLEWLKISNDIKNPLRFIEMKKLLARNAGWADNNIFIANLTFGDFPEWLTKAIHKNARQFISPEEVAYGGFLLCKYYKDTNKTAYAFHVKDEVIDITIHIKQIDCFDKIIQTLAIS